MSVFAISDLHLCVSDANKSMEEFGGRWYNYVERLCKNWNSVVSEKDSVIIPGDISWALGMENSFGDMKLLNSLNGVKYIGKGNHDLWWATTSKLNRFFQSNHFHTLNILYNNAYKIEKYIVCGTRGWFYDEKTQKTVSCTDYAKMINREAVRLRLSLESGKRLQSNSDDSVLLFFHFPPVWDNFICREIIEVIHEYNVQYCYYGHIHNVYNIPSEFEYEGIKFRIISADYLNFIPYLLR